MALDITLTQNMPCTLPVPSRDVCINIFGASICPAEASRSLIKVVLNLFAQMNSVIAPLMPVFRIFNVLLDIVECIKAIPESIFPPNPQPIVKCIVQLITDLAEILKLLPPLALPITIINTIQAMILFLQALKIEIATIQQRLLTVVAAETRAASLPSGAGQQLLLSLTACERGRIASHVSNLSQSMKPLNTLVGLINKLLCLISLPPIPLFSELPADVSKIVAALELIIEILQTILSFIPGISIQASADGC